MLVLIAMGWLFIGDPECALVRRELVSAELFDDGALMLAKAGLPCRGDMLKSGVNISGGVLSDPVNGRQSTGLSICGEPVAG